MNKTPEQLCEQGTVFYSEGRHKDALKAYDDAIALDPNFGWAYYSKAIVVADLARESEAVWLYKKAISVGYDTAKTYYNMGIDLNALGRIEEAVEAYNKAIIRDPENANAYRNKGNSLMLLGRIGEAVEAYQKALELNPELIDVYADIGPLLEDLDRKEEALEYYDTCISQNPKNFRANYAKGCLLYREGRYEECIRNLEVALEPNGLHPGVCYYMGSAYEALNEKDKARDLYNRAFRMIPEASIQYCNRGQCFYALGEKKKAIKDFIKTATLMKTDKKTMLLPSVIRFMKNTLKEVIDKEKIAMRKQENMHNSNYNRTINGTSMQGDVDEIDIMKKELQEIQTFLEVNSTEKEEDKSVKQLLEEGYVLYTRGHQKDDAIEAYDEAIAKDPKCGPAYYCKATILMDSKMIPEAIELYKKAISAGYDTAQTYVHMGTGLSCLGRREEAVEAYSNALVKEPDNVEAYRNKGNCLMMLGRIAEAAKAYEKAIEIAPELYHAYADIGPVLEDLGRKEEALKYLDACLSEDPENFRANYAKGCLLFREGKYQECIRNFEVALEVNYLHPGTCYHIGSAYEALGTKDKAVEFYSRADYMTPEASIQYCNRGECYYALGQRKKALEDFIKMADLLESEKHVILLPSYTKHMRNTIAEVLKIEQAASYKERNTEIMSLVMKLKSVQDKWREDINGMKPLYEEETTEVDESLDEHVEVNKRFLIG